jgi:hypothetical protein
MAANKKKSICGLVNVCDVRRAVIHGAFQGVVVAMGKDSVELGGGVIGGIKAVEKEFEVGQLEV